MNKRSSVILAIFLASASFLRAQQNRQPHIESCGCEFTIDPEFIKLVSPENRVNFPPVARIDSSFKTECGYLIVPENRKKKNSRMIKLPYIIVRSKNPAKRPDPVLFTSGGPGNSSLSWAVNSTRHSQIEDRDMIAFEQRGTRFAIPHLRSFELDNAIDDSYRRNLNKDSAIIEGVKRYRKALLKRGIDLEGYSSDETVADIHDLLNQLKIDSVNLSGGSYSGGLMLSVLQKDPSKIRSLVIDSPKPPFVPIDEDEPVNFREALGVYFDYVAKDSTGKPQYDRLEERFDRYFTSIKDQTFYLPFLEAGTKDSISVAYTKNDLLQVVINLMFDDTARKRLAFVINDLIAGNHKSYMTELITGIFRRNFAPDGMRISVYCADETAWHSEKVVSEIANVYPYLPGFRVNDVYKAMCDCWKSKPISQDSRQGFYSPVPILLADGEMDPACRPLYVDRISHYMPNSQRILVRKKGHGVLGGSTMEAIVKAFLNEPMKKIVSTSENMIVY